MICMSGYEDQSDRGSSDLRKVERKDRRMREGSRRIKKNVLPFGDHGCKSEGRIMYATWEEYHELEAVKHQPRLWCSTYRGSRCSRKSKVMTMSWNQPPCLGDIDLFRRPSWCQGVIKTDVHTA